MGSDTQSGETISESTDVPARELEARTKAQSSSAGLSGPRLRAWKTTSTGLMNSP